MHHTFKKQYREEKPWSVAVIYLGMMSSKVSENKLNTKPNTYQKGVKKFYSIVWYQCHILN